MEPADQWQTIDEQGSINDDPAFANRNDIVLEGEAQAVSRRPAALVGIAVAVVMGTLFVQSLNQLRGQVASSVAVTITEEAIEPNDISVAPGESITFTNTFQNPQYIVSDDLCDENFECLNTATMFQGDSYTYTVPVGVAPGTYNIFAPLKPELTALVTIGGSAPVLSDPVVVDPVADPLPPEPVFEEPAFEKEADAGPTTLSAFQNPGPELPPDEIEENPLLAAIRNQLEQDNQGTTDFAAEPTEVAFDPGPQFNQFQPISGLPTNPHTVTTSITNPEFPVPEAVSHKPFVQPNTGPGHWLVAILSSLLLLGYFIYYRRGITILSE